MTNAQETNVKQEPLSEQAFLDTLINLCDDLAWGRPASEDRLFALTKEGAGPKNYVRLAEAFGMMLVKVESREYHRSQLIADLKTRNAELEEAHRLLAERNTHLMRTIQENYQTKKIVGQCEAMRKVIQLALTIARRPINTLILGPTGAGKEVIAKAIHFNSPRREGPFVAVNCTAIPDSLFESEMFGIEKGIATGVNARKGLIEEASGGTLFLDELADMTLPNQAKLLRVLEEREVLRVGSSKPVSVPPMPIWKKPSARATFGKISITASMWRKSGFLPCEIAEMTSFCWHSFFLSAIAPIWDGLGFRSLPPCAGSFCNTAGPVMYVN